MRKILFLALLLLGLPAVAQIAPVQKKLQLGELLPTDSVAVSLEYPRFRALSKSERRLLEAQGFRPEAEVAFHTSRSLSRGETLLDVLFMPVVERGGQWFEITDYDLRTRCVGPALSPALCTVVKSVQALAASSRYVDSSVLSTGRWVKIRVKAEGIYQLTDDQLRKMGFNDPSRVKLYGYGGRLLPDRFSFSGDDALIDDLCEQPLLRQEGRVLFFCEGTVRYESATRFSRNTFSDYSYYFLTEGDNPMALTEAEPPSRATTDVSTVRAHCLLDNDVMVWYGGGRDFYDSNELSSGYTFTLNLPGNVGGTYTVAYDVSASAAGSAASMKIHSVPDGKILASTNLAVPGEGESARGYRGSFSLAIPGDKVSLRVSTGQTGRLNYFYIRYDQQLSTAFAQSAFTTTETGPVRLLIDEADAQTAVLQLGNSTSSTCLLPASLGADGKLAAVAPDGEARFILLQRDKTYSSPEVVGPVANQDLHADAAIDYVIIVPASGKLTAEAERLAEAHRTHRGLRVKVVPADRLYNEFSSGTPDIGAYRRYLKMLYDRAATDADRPRYLLYFGESSYDNRMITSDWRNQNPEDFLLAGERNDHEAYQNSGYSIGTLHSYVTDDHVGYLDDGEGQNFTAEAIDLGIGRFPCYTTDDAAWLVDQAIRYMDNREVGAWKNRMWSLADVGDNNLHMGDAEDVIKQVAKSAPSSLLLRRIFPDAYQITQSAKGGVYPEATGKLRTAMQQGALIFNYNGHGRPERLSHNFLLEMSDMSANVSSALPLWIFASCEITPYDQILSGDLGRNALFNRSGGAIGVICAARSVYASYNNSLNRGVIKYLFSKDSDGTRRSFGDALRLTKAELVSTSPEIGGDKSVNKMKYVLLGDPALQLSYATPGISIDSINGRSVNASGSLPSLPVGGLVTFSGFVNADLSTGEPDPTFNGTLTGSFFMPRQTITCKGYNNDRSDPYVYSDLTQSVFEGIVSVKNGRFQLSFIVPRGTGLSAEAAELYLYAVSEDHRTELSGTFKRFCYNGLASGLPTDSLGPAVTLYLDRPDFVDGGPVASEATLYAAISDSLALSTLTGSMGHDMEVWIDRDPSTTRVVSDYFSFSPDSYREGSLAYPLTGLTPGLHTLSLRVWDANDNSTTRHLRFTVSDNTGGTKVEILAVPQLEGTTVPCNFVTTIPEVTSVDRQVTTEVYSLIGRRVWHGVAPLPAESGYTTIYWPGTDYSHTPLPPGIYLYRSLVGKEESNTRKLIIR